MRAEDVASDGRPCAPPVHVATIGLTTTLWSQPTPATASEPVTPRSTLHCPGYTNFSAGDSAQHPAAPARSCKRGTAAWEPAAKQQTTTAPISSPTAARLHPSRRAIEPTVPHRISRYNGQPRVASERWPRAPRPARHRRTLHPRVDDVALSPRAELHGILAQRWRDRCAGLGSPATQHVSQPPRGDGIAGIHCQGLAEGLFCSLGRCNRLVRPAEAVHGHNVVGSALQDRRVDRDGILRIGCSGGQRPDFLDVVG